jgi:hypothetical protein
MKYSIIAAAVLCIAAGTPVYSLLLTRAKLYFVCTVKQPETMEEVNAILQSGTFFIVKKNKHGFLPNTLNARKDFLGECASADPEAVNKILSSLAGQRVIQHWPLS